MSVTLRTCESRKINLTFAVWHLNVEYFQSEEGVMDMNFSLYIYLQKRFEQNMYNLLKLQYRVGYSTALHYAKIIFL